jgi:DNA-binding response OmpR family regulator
VKAARILIADDDRAHRAALSEYLRLSGYEVVECADGEEALQRLAQLTPDLVLLDVDMPRLDGFQTLERLRRLSAFDATPVLFLSAMEGRTARVRGLELGADDFVRKPFDRAELLARIRGALRRKARAGAPVGAIAGDIGQLGLDSLLQTLELGRRAARVVLEDCGGELELDAGMLVACRYGHFAGRAALARLLWVARGRFRVELVEPKGEARGPLGSFQEAMIGAATQLDEARRELRALEEDAWIEPGERSEPSPLAGLERLRGLFPLQVRDVVVLLEGALPENAREVVSGLADARLRRAER